MQKAFIDFGVDCYIGIPKISKQIMDRAGAHCGTMNLAEVSKHNCASLPAKNIKLVAKETSREELKEKSMPL